MGGLCETHIDPYGYIEGAGLYESPEVQRLKQTGDIFGTLMGYLNHVEAGGATAFCQPFHEEIIRYGTCGLSFVHGSSHIRSVLIVVEYRNWRRLDVRILFAILKVR